VALLPAVLIISVSFTSRIRGSNGLFVSFWLASGVLLFLWEQLRRSTVRTGRVLRWEFAARHVHYVQLTMQCCVYFYWSLYWNEVRHHFLLIIAQVIFAYGLEMWYRRSTWSAGFGPVPIVLSINLFLWFRDDWFVLQFLMVIAAVLSKEFIKWRRGDRLTHVFNP